MLNCSYPCIFDACTPNNYLWIFFYLSVVPLFFLPPWSLALFSDGVIPPNFVPVNRPLSAQSLSSSGEPCHANRALLQSYLLFHMNTRFRRTVMRFLETSALLWKLSEVYMATNRAIPSTPNQLSSCLYPIHLLQGLA